MFFFKVLSTSLFGFSLLSPAFAQEIPARSVERTPSQELQVKKEFVDLLRETVLGKCNETAQIPDVNKRYKSCKCYTDAYIDRYSPETLFSMNQWAQQNPGKSQIILLMLQPERTKCNIP